MNIKNKQDKILILIGNDFQMKKSFSDLLDSSYNSNIDIKQIKEITNWNQLKKDICQKEILFALPFDFQNLLVLNKNQGDLIEQYLQNQFENINKCFPNLSDLLDAEVIHIVIINNGQGFQQPPLEFKNLQSTLYNFYWNSINKYKVLYRKFLYYLLENITLQSSFIYQDKDSILLKEQINLILNMQTINSDHIILKYPLEEQKSITSQFKSNLETGKFQDVKQQLEQHLNFIGLSEIQQWHDDICLYLKKNHNELFNKNQEDITYCKREGAEQVQNIIIYGETFDEIIKQSDNFNSCIKKTIIEQSQKLIMNELQILIQKNKNILEENMLNTLELYFKLDKNFFNISTNIKQCIADSITKLKGKIESFNNDLKYNVNELKFENIKYDLLEIAKIIKQCEIFQSQKYQNLLEQFGIESAQVIEIKNFSEFENIIQDLKILIEKKVSDLMKIKNQHQNLLKFFKQIIFVQEIYKLYNMGEFKSQNVEQEIQNRANECNDNLLNKIKLREFDKEFIKSYEKLEQIEDTLKDTNRKQLIYSKLIEDIKDIYQQRENNIGHLKFQSNQIISELKELKGNFAQTIIQEMNTIENQINHKKKN